MKIKFLILSLILLTAPLYAQSTRISSYPGAVRIVTAQVATSTTAATLIGINARRRMVIIRNLDSTISVYVGPATVTSSNGMLIKAGESVNVETVALIQVISASGTPTVATLEITD